MSETKIYAEDSDGNRVDITEGVRVLYDAVHASMDWGSGFLSVEDVAGILRVAQAAGFLVPEKAGEMYAEYARTIARYWPDDGTRNTYGLDTRERAVSAMRANSSEAVNCATCGELALYNMAAKTWEHAEHNPGHEVRLWQ